MRDLTKIEIQEKAKRKRNRLNMKGLRTPPGTRPRVPELSGQPVWRPMPYIMPSFTGIDFMSRIRNIFMPAWRWRRRAAREEERRLEGK